MYIYNQPTKPSMYWPILKRLGDEALNSFLYQLTWVVFSLSLPFLLQGKPPKIRRAQLIARFIKKDTSSYSCLLYAFCLSVSLNWEIWKIKKTTEPHQQKNRKCNAKTIITMKLHPQNIITKGKKAMTMKKKRISLASFSALFACKSLIATFFFCVEFNLLKLIEPCFSMLTFTLL